MKPSPALLFALAAALLLGRAAAAGEARVADLRVTVLSTMLVGGAGEGEVGEWGFAALVEADGRRILFDTGLRPQTVRHNASVLGLDLADITDVVLSHNHADHTGGLLTLRREFAKKNPTAFSRAHVGRGIFWDRGNDRHGRPHNTMPALKPAYESAGGTFIEHAASTELAPGVWFVSPIPRTYPERNYGVAPGTRVATPDGARDDDIPEDSALVIDTDGGLVVITGCGHAGVVNTLAAARSEVRAAPVRALIGGFHLLLSDEANLQWTADKFREAGVANLLAAHCTGLEATYRLRPLSGLTRETAVVAAVGATFDLERGIASPILAR